MKKHYMKKLHFLYEPFKEQSAKLIAKRYAVLLRKIHSSFDTLLYFAHSKRAHRENDRLHCIPYTRRVYENLKYIAVKVIDCNDPELYDDW